MKPAAFLILSAALALPGCNDMGRQPRYDHYEPSPLFSDGKALQSPPDGVVSRDAPHRAAALATRPPMTAALLERGRDRFQIFCTPCHDEAGTGHGAIPARGFPQPPSFHIDRLREATPEYFVEVITNGHGVMYPYAQRVPPADRWAIAAYIQALQLSQGAPVALLSDEDREALAAADAP